MKPLPRSSSSNWKRRQATTKRRLSKEERTYKATVPKAMAQMGMGKPSPTSPLYIPTPSLQLPGPTVASIRKCIGSRAAMANQVVTHHQRNNLIQAIQGGNRGNLPMCKSLHASKPKGQILRTRPASIRPCPQGGNCWDTIVSRGGQGSQ